MDKTNIKKRGGKRAGAGRPPREVKRVGVSMRVEPEIKQGFKAMCDALGMSQSRVFTACVRAFQMKNKKGKK